MLIVAFSDSVFNRSFNSNLAYASLQAETADLCRGVPVFNVHGSCYHRVRNILPIYVPKNVSVSAQAAVIGSKSSDDPPKFLSLYSYDPELDGESKISKRTRGALDCAQGKRIMLQLQQMMKTNRIFYAVNSVDII